MTSCLPFISTRPPRKEKSLKERRQPPFSEAMSIFFLSYFSSFLNSFMNKTKFLKEDLRFPGNLKVE